MADQWQASVSHVVRCRGPKKKNPQLSLVAAKLLLGHHVFPDEWLKHVDQVGERRMKDWAGGANGKLDKANWAAQVAGEADGIGQRAEGLCR